jgi:hypothetical protein
MDIVNAIINGFVAFGTLLLGALAIWGDRIRAWLTGPQLSLVLENTPGALIPCGPVVRIFYLLRVVNRRPSAIAMNCQVQLKKMWRRLPNGEFGEVRLPYPLVMSWPPSEMSPMSVTLRRDQLVDFGFLEQGRHFMPSARMYPNNFDGVVRARDTMRYAFEIVSDNFVSPDFQTFEVTWDGQWSDNPEKMATHLRISEVKGKS